MQLGNLAKVLSELYPTPADLRRLASESGLPAGPLDFSGSAIQFWFSALERAELSGHVVEIIDVARYEYPNNKALESASWDYIKDAKTFGRSLNGYVEVPHDSSDEIRDLMREMHQLTITLKIVEHRLDRLEQEGALKPQVRITNAHMVFLFLLLGVAPVMLGVVLYMLASGGA